MRNENPSENQGQPSQPADDERVKLGVGIADFTGDSRWLIVYGSFGSLRVVVDVPAPWAMHDVRHNGP